MYDASGEVIARFADLHLLGGTIFNDPQGEVRLNIQSGDVVLGAGSSGRQRFEGLNFNPLEIMPDSQGILRVEMVGDGSVDLEQIVFPEFHFGPTAGTALEPAGLFHVYCVTNTNDAGPAVPQMRSNEPTRPCRTIRESSYSVFPRRIRTLSTSIQA